MKYTTPSARRSRLGHVLAAVAATACFVACTVNDPGPGPERTASIASPVFTNGGFTNGFTGWTVGTNLNSKGIVVATPETFADLQLQTGGTDFSVILTGTNQPDPDLGAAASLRWCRYGNECALVNQHGHNQNSNSLSQAMTVAAGDVDPSDGLVHVRFTVAPVLQNPAHTAVQQPYYFVRLSNDTQNTILYSDFNLSGAGIPWQKVNAGTANEIDYTDWQLVDIPGTGGAINVGDQVTLLIIATGCEPGGHWGEIYVDGVGDILPGLNIEGTAPAEVNSGANLTYTFTYKNGSAASETGVVIDVATPTDTTFQSIVAPAGATCTTPAVGAAGTVVCTFTGAVAAGASGTFTVTVNVTAGTADGTTISESSYTIQSTQETALAGPPINSLVGCTLDSQCVAGNWCDESTNDCTPTLANGKPVPTDPKHTNPTLNGTCTAAAGALVCTSKVCDTKDNECGYANGDGPCTVTDGGVVCRSGACSTNGTCEPAGGCNVDADCTGGDWCEESTHTCTPKEANGTPVPTDPPHTNPTLNGTCTAAAGALVCVSGVCDTKDNECGYANGDGPCTVGNGGVVCRSGACSTNNTCEPAGGCNVDADCTGGDWCEESTHTCTPKEANGTPVPTDPPHTNPTLNGTCTAAAGALVCVSGVCDTNDNECGYANGDGPCTPANGGVVCRSGVCSASGVCEPAGSCNVDADCASTQWCDESTHTCTAKEANGQPVPTDPPHTNPTLNGTCTAQAGALVCSSGVCDTNDNECGYANGDGPCTSSNGGTVCRSGACSTSGVCEPAGGCEVNADCASPTPICDPTTHTCVAADAGIPEAGAEDAGQQDASTGEDSGEPADASSPGNDGSITGSDASTPADAGAAHDAAAEEDAADAGGFVEGGGLSCGVGAPSGASPAMAGMLAGIALIASRRRARAAASKVRRP